MKGVLKAAWMVAALVVAGVAAYWLGTRVGARPELAGTELKTPVDVTGHGLIDQHGSPVDLAGDFKGQVTLVFFGYTRCPDVCPLTMARLTRAYGLLPDHSGVRVVMVTVDPGYDTPEVLARYLAGFHEDFVGLTGSNSQVAEAARAFFVGYMDAGELVAHTDIVAVVDRRGRMRYVYGQDVVPRLNEDLPELLRRL